MTMTEESTNAKISEGARERLDEIIRRACRKAGVAEKGDEFVRDGRSWPYVRQWLKNNTLWAPDAKDRLDVDAIYAKFNNPPLTAAKPEAES